MDTVTEVTLPGGRARSDDFSRSDGARATEVATTEVTLPGGFRIDGTWHREASLRPLTGRDEAFLLEAGRTLLPVQRTTALLTCCLTRLGPLTPVTPEAVRALTVGDREALLLHLRRLTLGERIECLLTCPQEGCGEQLELELAVSDLLLPPYGREDASGETVITDDGACYRVRFRLPTGADQEAAAALAHHDSEAAATLLLRRCVESVIVEPDGGEPTDGLPPAVTRALPQLMADLDPQAELILNLVCPACGTGFDVPFDIGDYFYRELAGQVRNLYREVHWLALHYHWGEAEIMAMPGRKRHLYLELLAEALGKEGTW